MLDLSLDLVNWKLLIKILSYSSETNEIPDLLVLCAIMLP
jgi:hypothetical protein